MKDAIQTIAENLAVDRYDKEFYSLPAVIRDRLYNEATSRWTDNYAASCDAAYEKSKYDPLWEMDRG